VLKTVFEKIGFFGFYRIRIIGSTDFGSFGFYRIRIFWFFGLWTFQTFIGFGSLWFFTETGFGFLLDLDCIALIAIQRCTRYVHLKSIGEQMIGELDDNLSIDSGKPL
jgi:hypothetical protein